jgi:hypothetical protein
MNVLDSERDSMEGAEVSLLSTLCKRKTTNWQNVPGGENFKSVEQSMFAFLSKPKSNSVTFGSSSPFSMSFTSTMSDGISTDISFSKSDSDAYSNQGAGLAAIEPGGSGWFLSVLGGGGNNRDTATSVKVGKTSSSSTSAEKTVSIVLDDSDTGERSRCLLFLLFIVNVFLKAICSLLRSQKILCTELQYSQRMLESAFRHRSCISLTMFWCVD